MRLYYWGTPLEKEATMLQFILLASTEIPEWECYLAARVLYRNFMKINPTFWETE